MSQWLRLYSICTYMYMLGGPYRYVYYYHMQMLIPVSMFSNQKLQLGPPQVLVGLSIYLSIDVSIVNPREPTDIASLGSGGPPPPLSYLHTKPIKLFFMYIL